MTERTPEASAAMTRRELAKIQADEMSAALNPFPARPDDEISSEEKSAMSETVAMLQARHRRELSEWTKARG